MDSLKNNIFPLAVALATGMLWGYSTDIRVLACIIFMPIAWSCTNKRWIAGFVPTIYVLASSRGLIEGVATFFDQPVLLGAIVWLVTAIPHYIAGFFAWSGDVNRRVTIGIPVLCLLLLIPPVMFVGWGHPLLAAGIWFPSTGSVSLLLTLSLMILLGFLLHKRKWLLLLTLLVLLVTNAVWRYQVPNVNVVSNIAAHQTDFHFGIHGNKPLKPIEILQRHWLMQEMVSESEETIHVLPESVGGNWDKFIANSWQVAMQGQNKQVLIGAYLSASDDSWKNVVMLVNAETSIPIYEQRIPMTGGMFNPFKGGGFSPSWAGSSVALVSGKRVGFAVCFEHVILLPMLQVSLNSPEIVIATASIWWSPTQLQNAQRQSLRLWQLWLGVPVIESINGKIS